MLVPIPETSLRWTHAVALLLLTGACSSPASTPGRLAVTERQAGSLHGTDVSGVIHRPALRGTTTDGRPFDLRSAPDVTAVFFGYTRCPDVCPTTMADLASAARRLAPRLRARVHVVFVTQDLPHDTAAVLRRWLDRFDHTFIGVRPPSVASDTEVLTALKAPATDLPPVGSARAVEHTGSVYVFAADRVVVYTGGTTPSQYAEDLTALAS